MRMGQTSLYCTVTQMHQAICLFVSQYFFFYKWVGQMTNTIKTERVSVNKLNIRKKKFILQCSLSGFHNFWFEAWGMGKMEEEKANITKSQQERQNKQKY